MKKILSFIAMLMLISIFAASIIAQTPQYYNKNNGATSNSFPFNQAGGKAVNTLILAGELNLPNPLPSGKKITTVYFRTATAGTRVFTNLHILMAQSTLTTLTTGTFYAGPWDTVYNHSTATLTSTAGGWMSITLDKGYNYDPAKSLIIFVGQCGATGSGMSVYNSSLTSIRRVWSVGGCPFAPYASGDASVVDFGVDVVDASPLYQPELIYYNFENNPTLTSIKNCGTAPVGTSPSPITGHTLTAGGQFDTCVTGTASVVGRIATGWNCNLGTSDWTIGFWVSNLTEPSSGSPCYLFGDAGSGSFRCFYGGAALPNNMLLRGSFTDITIPCPMPGSHYFHFVKSGGNIIVYMDGALVSTNARTVNIATGTGFYVAGYGASNYMVGKMDEFRLYNWALSAADVSASWNLNLPVCGGGPGVGINNTSENNFDLLQNYPNPFNNNTIIAYYLKENTNVILKVYDLMGKEVSTLVNKSQIAGKYEVEFNASNLPSGIYVYQLTTNDYSISKRMVVEK